MVNTSNEWFDKPAQEGMVTAHRGALTLARGLGGAVVDRYDTLARQYDARIVAPAGGWPENADLPRQFLVDLKHTKSPSLFFEHYHEDRNRRRRRGGWGFLSPAKYIGYSRLDGGKVLGRGTFCLVKLSAWRRLVNRGKWKQVTVDLPGQPYYTYGYWSRVEELKEEGVIVWEAPLELLSWAEFPKDLVGTWTGTGNEWVDHIEGVVREGVAHITGGVRFFGSVLTSQSVQALTPRAKLLFYCLPFVADEWGWLRAIDLRQRLSPSLQDAVGSPPFRALQAGRHLAIHGGGLIELHNHAEYQAPLPS